MDQQGFRELVNKADIVLVDDVTTKQIPEKRRAIFTRQFCYSVTDVKVGIPKSN
jgi:hypothetical protein